MRKTNYTNNPRRCGGWVSVGVMAAGLGLSLLSSLFVKKPKTPSPLRDDKPPNLSTRGSYIPLVIGKRRVGPVICAIGNRYASPVVVSGGKGGGKQTTGYQYYEDGVHALCVGPASRLDRIVENGKVVSTADFTSSGNPSGTAVTVKGRSAKLYWGECDQPVSSAADITQVASRFPHICYVHWISKSLGDAPRWPAMEYEVTCDLTGSGLVTLTQTDYWLSPSGGAEGVNAAHALYMLLTARYPYGCAIDPEWLDLDAFEALGVLAEQEGFAVNLLIRDGAEAASAIASLLHDFGVMMPQDGGLLVPLAIREVSGSDVPLLVDSDIQTAPEPEIEEVQGERPVARLVFVFNDETHDYRTIDIKVDDDSQAEIVGRFKARQVAIESVTNFDLAAAVADRSQQEELANISALKFSMLRGSRLLRPGMVFDHATYHRQRVTGVQLNTESNTVAIESIRDLYSLEATGVTPEAPPLGPQVGDGVPEPDEAFRPIELPTELAVPGLVTMTVLRSAANLNATGAFVWLSSDGTTYRNIGSQDIPAVSGILIDALDGVTDDIGDGPTFTIDTASDPNAVEDFTSDSDSWEAGEQLLIIEDEIIFLRNITAMGGATWRLDGLKRAKYSSIMAAHSTGVRVWIVKPGNQSRFTGGLIASAATRYVKTQPFNVSDEVDLADVTAEPITFA